MLNVDQIQIDIFYTLLVTNTVEIEKRIKDYVK